MCTKKELRKDSKNNLIDLDAKFYTEHSTLQTNLADELIRKFDYSSNKRILDVGCGDGFNTYKIAKSMQKDGCVIGIDLSPSMIELAKNKYQQSDSTIKFYHCDAACFSAEEKFDRIVSFSCFHWIRKGAETLKKLCQLLNRGGEVNLLTYPSESRYYEFMQKALDLYFPQYSVSSAYKTMLSTKDYREILNNAGMEIEYFQIQEKYTQSNNLEEIKDFIKGWLTSFVPLPKNLHESYLGYVCQYCKPYFKKNKSNKLCLPYTELVIRAKKK